MTTLTSKAVRFITAAALGLGLLWSAPSRGAPPNTIGNSVAVCDPWNPQRCAQPDASGNLPITGSFSAAGFTPATTGTPITATTLGVTGTLPAGAVVAAFNVGTTNTAYCQLGASATVNDIAIPPASWFAFTVGAATQLTCITSTSTTTVNMVGGSGLPTGSGGGSGGSGGGAVTVTPTNVAGVVSSSAGSNLVLKSSAGGLQTLTVTIGAVSGWIMVFDATSAPADGAVTPAYCRYVKSDGTGGATSFSWGNYPLTFSTGITAVFSSTGCFTKTASATATFQGQVQ